MAVTNTALDVISGVTRFNDTQNQNTAVSVKASAATIYAIIIDNTANAAKSYTKLWNTASGSVVVFSLTETFWL